MIAGSTVVAGLLQVRPKGATDVAPVLFCGIFFRTSHLAPRTSHLAPRTSHLAPRTSFKNHYKSCN
ncbi:hypothetical protein FD720_02735 [Photobacterium damselae subsp. damselae]|nr:hypothetical protein FD720_02735 [Photobacterium damselae subsp. damselae]